MRYTISIVKKYGELGEEGDREGMGSCIEEFDKVMHMSRSILEGKIEVAENRKKMENQDDQDDEMSREGIAEAG